MSDTPSDADAGDEGDEGRGVHKAGPKDDGAPETSDDSDDLAGWAEQTETGGEGS